MQASKTRLEALRRRMSNAALPAIPEKPPVDGTLAA